MTDNNLVDLASRRRAPEANAGDAAYAMIFGPMCACDDPTEAALRFVGGLCGYLATRGVTLGQIVDRIAPMVAKGASEAPPA